MGRVRLQSRSQRWALGMGVGTGGSEEGEESGGEFVSGGLWGHEKGRGGQPLQRTGLTILPDRLSSLK